MNTILGNSAKFKHLKNWAHKDGTWVWARKRTGASARGPLGLDYGKIEVK